MSCPSSRMRPAVGLSTPVSRLTTVVLPAPFGPINAWRAPFSILSDRPATAAMPPKCFCKATVSSTTGTALASFPGGDRHGRGRRRESARDAFGEHAHAAGPQPDAVAADEHDQNQHETDPELPVLRRQIGDRILHHL